MKVLTEKLRFLLATGLILVMAACSSGGPNVPGEGLPEDPVLPPGEGVSGEDLTNPAGDPKLDEVPEDAAPEFGGATGPGASANPEGDPAGPSEEQDPDQNQNPDPDQDPDQDSDQDPDDDSNLNSDVDPDIDSDSSETSSGTSGAPAAPAPGPVQSETVQAKDFLATTFYYDGPSYFVTNDQGELITCPTLHWSVGPDSPDLVQILNSTNNIVIASAGAAGQRPMAENPELCGPFLPSQTYRLAVYDTAISNQPIFPVADVTMPPVAQASSAYPLQVTVSEEQELGPKNHYTPDAFTISWDFPQGLPPGNVEVCLSRPNDTEPEAVSDDELTPAGLLGCPKERCVYNGECYLKDHFRVSTATDEIDDNWICGGDANLKDYDQDRIIKRWVECNPNNEGKESPGGNYVCDHPADAPLPTILAWVPKLTMETILSDEAITYGLGQFAIDLSNKEDTSQYDDYAWDFDVMDSIDFGVAVSDEVSPVKFKVFPGQAFNEVNPGAGAIETIVTTPTCFAASTDHGSYEFLPKKPAGIAKYKISWYYKVNGESIGQDLVQNTHDATIKKLYPQVTLSVSDPEATVSNIMNQTVNEITVAYEIKNATEAVLLMTDKGENTQSETIDPLGGDWPAVENQDVNEALESFFAQETGSDAPAFTGSLYRLSGKYPVKKAKKTQKVKKEGGEKEPWPKLKKKKKKLHALKLDEYGHASGTFKVKSNFFKSRYVLLAMGDYNNGNPNFTNYAVNGSNFMMAEIPEPDVGDIDLLQSQIDSKFGIAEAAIPSIKIRNAYEVQWVFTHPASCDPATLSQFAQTGHGVWEGSMMCRYRNMNPGFRVTVTDFLGQDQVYELKYKGSGGYGIDIPQIVVACEKPGACSVIENDVNYSGMSTAQLVAAIKDLNVTLRTEARLVLKVVGYQMGKPFPFKEYAIESQHGNEDACDAQGYPKKAFSNDNLHNAETMARFTVDGAQSLGTIRKFKKYGISANGDKCYKFRGKATTLSDAVIETPTIPFTPPLRADIGFGGSTACTYSVSDPCDEAWEHDCGAQDRLNTVGTDTILYNWKNVDYIEHTCAGSPATPFSVSNHRTGSGTVTIDKARSEGEQKNCTIRFNGYEDWWIELPYNTGSCGAPGSNSDWALWY